MKAYLKFHRQSPRKVRLVAEAVRGKSVAEARTILGAAAKRAALPLRKLLDSAVANAGQGGRGGDERLYVKGIRVDKGVTLSRYMPRARGAVSPINKRTSNILLVLEERPGKQKQL